MSQPVLSILICSITKRKEMLSRLLDILSVQKTDSVEILVQIDDGEMIIGQKRQVLLQKATGKYVVFIDDDDEVSHDYVSKILNCAKQDKDCISMIGTRRCKGMNDIPMKWSNKFAYPVQTQFKIQMPINHISPVKRTLALIVGFSSLDVGQDTKFGRGLKAILKTQASIPTDNPLYLYNMVNGHPQVVQASQRHRFQGMPKQAVTKQLMRKQKLFAKQKLVKMIRQKRNKGGKV